MSHQTISHRAVLRLVQSRPLPRPAWSHRIVVVAWGCILIAAICLVLPQ